METTAMQDLIEYIESGEFQGSVSDILDMSIRLMEKEKEQLRNFWIEGNKQGWAMQTDWTEDADKFYNETFKKTTDGNN